MKTKISIFTGMIAILIAILTIASCKKKEEPAPTPTTPTVSPTDSTSQTTRASDQSNVENESDQAMDDVNTILGEVSTTRGVQAICGMTYDSSTTATTGLIVMTYDSTMVCPGGKKRSGKIKIQLLVDNGVVVRWSNPGATAKITFEDYKVTNIATNKSIEFDGIYSVTDSTGYTLYELYNGTVVVYKVRGSVQVTFNDGSQGTWNIAKRRYLDISIANNIAYYSVSGDTTINNHSQAAYWGINRVGDSFTVTVPAPVNYKILYGTCLYKPRGVVKYFWLNHEITISYGVSSSGVYPDPNTCPWGYSVEWPGGNANIAYY